VNPAEEQAVREAQKNNGLAAMLMQLAPTWKYVSDRIKALLDQPVIRQPYSMPASQSLVVPAGRTGVPFPNTDFSNSLEWPFEIWKVKPVQDPAHTFQDWRINLKDQTFDRDLHKAHQRVDGIVEDNTGVWRWDFPWIMRPKGGGFTITVDNLDTVNPITVEVTLVGFLLIPRA
jgi:hypothetical protein